MKSRLRMHNRGQSGRTPQGVRGLKCVRRVYHTPCAESHPARGAWIEISSGRALTDAAKVAPRKGCVD